VTTTEGPAVLAITDEVVGHTRVVRCAGEIDMATAPGLRTRLSGLQIDGPPRLLIDLTEVTFIDSLGLGALIGAHKRARVLQGSFLVVPGPAARRLLTATALDRVFDVHDTVESAINHAG
jgi:anti-sigma B factor antagonist